LAGVVWMTEREIVKRIWGPFFGPTVAITVLFATIALWGNWFPLVDPLNLPENFRRIYNNAILVLLALGVWKVLITLAQHGTFPDVKEERR
jgi:hypothetical protein